MKKPSDGAILERAEERFKDCQDYWEPHHTRFTKNKAFNRNFDGAQWDKDERIKRDASKRITLSENLLGPFGFQVANDLKQSDFGVIVLPKDSGTDVETAEVRAGLHRGIQEIGGFKDAFNRCIDDLIDGGLGAFRFVTRKQDPKSFRKEIEYLELDPTRIFHGDGNNRKSDFSDVVDSFVYEPYQADRFKSEFGKDPRNFLSRGESPLWGSNNTPWVTEYFYREERPETLVMSLRGKEEYLSDLKAILKDDNHKFWLERPDLKLLRDLGHLTVDDLVAKDKDGEPIADESYRCQIWYAKLAHKEVLSVEAWPGYCIPNFLATGREVSINGEKRYECLTERAFDVQRAHNFSFSALVERAGLAPKVRIFMPIEGMDPKFQAIYNDISTWDGVVPYRSFQEGTANRLDKPYQEAPIQSDPAFVNLRAMTTQGIRDVLGMWETSLGAQSNEKSGVAINARERQSDTGNADWAMNLAKPAEYSFRAVDEVLDKIYDVPTQVRIVGEDEKQKVIQVAALREGEDNPYGYYDLNRGKYDIGLKLAPSADTKREDQRRGMEMLFQQNPALTVGLAPEYIALQDWKNAQKMSKVAGKLRAAQFPTVNFEEEEGQQQLPPQVAQQMQQMQMQMQQMGEALQKIGPENEKLKIENAAIKADKTNDTERVRIERFKAEVDARAKGVDMTVKQGDLALKADAQAHEKRMDHAEMRMEAHAMQHGEAKDGADFRLKAGAQAHQQDKDRASHEQAGEKMRLDHEAKISAQADKPTGAAGKTPTPGGKG